MPDRLEAKTGTYEDLLARAVGAAEAESEDGQACLEMAEAYLADGRHYAADGDHVTALASYSYGHGWLDAGARCGELAVPTEGDLFAI